MGASQYCARDCASTSAYLNCKLNSTTVRLIGTIAIHVPIESIGNPSFLLQERLREQMSADVISSRAMQWATKVQSIADQARDLTLEAAQSVSAKYADETKAVDIDKLLEGRSDREKIDGMRRTIARSSRGVDMSEHFASVVKNVASSNLELRKLVYIYIARYAESQPDLALLSINTIQKALTDQNQIVRALALRVMSSIRVPSISGIVELAIKRCCSDSSPFVRKISAISIVKLNALNPDMHTRSLEYLRLLLADDVPSVISSALEAFEAIYPTRLELLHPNYRRICAALSQMDPFGQVSALRVLESYARRCFTSPKQVFENVSDPEDFYNQTTTTNVPSSDLSLLSKNVQSLLRSQNSAVVLAGCRVLRSLGNDVQQNDIAAALITLLRRSSDIQYISLSNIAVLAMERPLIWNKFAKHFLIHPTDSEPIWQLKLEIITLIISPDNATLLLSELEQYSRQSIDERLARDATNALGKSAQHMPGIAQECLSLLFDHMKSDSELLAGQSVVAIRHLIQLNPAGHVNEIKTLIKALSKITAPAARASIYWLVAENLKLLPRYAPDVLRIGAKEFCNEDEQVRLQILTLAVKMYVVHCQHSNEQDVEEMNTAIQEVDDAHAAHDLEQVVDSPNDSVKPDTETQQVQEDLPNMDSPIPKLYAYITQLARYDMSYDLRDRLRTYKVLASTPNWVLTQRLLFSPKPLPAFISPSSDRSKFAIGSSSLIVGAEIFGYADPPPWSQEVIGQAEREVEAKTTVAKQFTNKSSLPSSRSTTPSVFGKTAGEASHLTKPGKSKLTGISSLDDFYATTSEEEEEEESETSEDEDDSGSEESSEEDESEETDSDSEDEEEALVQSKR